MCGMAVTYVYQERAGLLLVPATWVLCLSFWAADPVFFWVGLSHVFLRFYVQPEAAWK